MKVYCSALGPGLGNCEVVAHVVISMDRMYNGRAATMNTIASGLLMRWIALAFQQGSDTAGNLVRNCEKSVRNHRNLARNQKSGP